MAYVKSSKIKMFPSSWRRKEYNPEANLNTEENLTNISRRISAQSYDSYVISKDGNEITFVIHGYWFKADLSDVIVDESPLFAKIKLVNSVPDGNTDFNNLTLVPTTASVPGQLDDNLEIPENPDNDTNEFHGVEFYTSAIPTPWPENVFELQLLDSNHEVPIKSYLNISTEQVQNGNNSNLPISEQFTTKSLSSPVIETTSIYGYGGMSIYATGPLNVYSTDSVYFNAATIYASKMSSSTGSIFLQANSSIYLTAGSNISIKTANSNILLSASNISLYGTTSISGNTNTHSIYPASTDTYNLGTSSKYYASAYINNANLRHIIGSQLFMEATSSIILGGYSAQSTNIYIGTDWDAQVATPYFTEYAAIGGNITEIVGNGALIQLGSGNINLSTSNAVYFNNTIINSPSSSDRVSLSLPSESGTLLTEEKWSESYTHGFKNFTIDEIKTLVRWSNSTSLPNWGDTTKLSKNDFSMKATYIRLENGYMHIGLNFSAPSGWDYPDSLIDAWICVDLGAICRTILNKGVFHAFMYPEYCSFTVTPKRDTLSGYGTRVVATFNGETCCIGFDTDAANNKGFFLEATVLMQTN